MIYLVFFFFPFVWLLCSIHGAPTAAIRTFRAILGLAYIHKLDQNLSDA